MASTFKENKQNKVLNTVRHLVTNLCITPTILSSLFSSKSRPSIAEDRWSKSNTSLEKSPFSKPGLHTVTSVPEIGRIFLTLICYILLNIDAFTKLQS